MLPGLNVEAFVLIFGVTVIAAIIQRTTGQAFGTILVGFVALLAPGYVPGAVIVLAFFATSLSVGLDLSSVRFREITPAIIGRLIGAYPGAMLVAVIAGSHVLDVVIGLTILVGVALSLKGVKVVRTPATLGVAGFASGFFGTLTAVGAPPMSLIYQHEEAKAARATLNFFFLIGVIGSIVALGLEGVIERSDIYLVGALIPAVLIGVFLSRPIAKRMEGRSLRPAALILTTVAAISLLWRSLW